jgi:uncharacterized membrane-anchored protein
MSESIIVALIGMAGSLLSVWLNFHLEKNKQSSQGLSNSSQTNNLSHTSSSSQAQPRSQQQIVSNKYQIISLYVACIFLQITSMLSIAVLAAALRYFLAGHSMSTTEIIVVIASVVGGGLAFYYGFFQFSNKLNLHSKTGSRFVKALTLFVGVVTIFYFWSIQSL